MRAPGRHRLRVLAACALSGVVAVGPAATVSYAKRPAAPQNVVVKLRGGSPAQLVVTFRKTTGTVEVRLRGAGTSKLRLTRSTAAGKRGRLTTALKPARALPATAKVQVRRCRAHGPGRCSGWSRSIKPAGLSTGLPESGGGSENGGGGGGGGAVGVNGGPRIGACPLLPPTHAFNQRVDALPVDPRSDAYIASIGLTRTVHPDFGSADLGAGPGGFGIPYVVVPRSQPLIPVDFTMYGSESDPGPYPIPLDAPIEGGAGSDGDRHVLAVREGDCKLFEIGNAYPRAGRWEASGGAVWDLNTGAPRPARWTSADAAGLPILPGLARYDEVAAGEIRHALRFTVRRTQRAYIAPASHWASPSTDQSLPPMGLRVRMRASYDTSRITGQAAVVARALKTYGLIVADNGSDWYVTGAPDPRWDDNDLRQLKSIPGSAFEAVQTGDVVRP